jgi:hypothetical protein
MGAGAWKTCCSSALCADAGVVVGHVTRIVHQGYNAVDINPFRKTYMVEAAGMKTNRLYHL